MNNVASETKRHYKSYKAGKHWVVAGITAMTLGLGLMVSTETAAADDTMVTGENATAKLTAQAATPAQQTTLKTQASGEANSESSDGAVEKPAEEAPNDMGSEEPVTAPTVNKDQEKVGLDASDEPEGETPTPEAGVPGTSGNKSSTATGDSADKNPAVSDPAVPAEDTQVNDEESASVTPKPIAMRAPAAVSPIWGVNASEWLPDATLRDIVIRQINVGAPTSTITGKPYYVATDSNLYQYVDKLTDLNDYVGVGNVANFAGLGYFTNLQTLSLTRMQVPISALIDFSVVPLASVSLHLANDGANHDMTTIMDTYFGSNLKLRFLRLGNSYLTGNIPDLSKYTNLEMIYLANNQLTGSIPSLKTIPNLWSLDVSHNQLSGAFPDVGNWPSMTMVDVSYNQLSGALPDLSGFRGTMTYMYNHLSNGVIQLLGKNDQPIVNYGVYQRLIGNTHKISAANRTFDPVTGVVTGFQDMATGQVDDNEGTWTAAIANGITVAYGEPDPNMATTDIAAWATTAEDATNWFSIQRISGNKVGLTFTAKDDVPDGTYTIQVVNQSFGALWGYSAYLTFKVENEILVDPGNPGKPDPGITTGTVTIVNVDQDGKIISQTQQSGNVGDAFTINAQTLTGYKLVGKSIANGTYTAANQTITFTYQALNQGGDGDTVNPDVPAIDKTVDTTNGGDADQVVVDKQSQRSTRKRTGTVNLNAASSATLTQQATKQQAAAATTLPQTDEATVSPWAGLALLLGGALTGFALNRKRRH
ncbi:MucBP domain-containing protein [Levilactobacillus sp. N40-8-2]|uniref:MucBP domain-containing protein n=1 Tax=Levilactobacillus muriae TaxID=3238987 RepID=UPI0038B3C97C